MSTGDWRFISIAWVFMAVVGAIMVWHVAHLPPQRPFVYIQDANGIGPTPY